MSHRFCPQCGSQVAGDDRYCPSCGALLTKQGDAPPTRRSRRDPAGRLLSPFVLGAIVVAGLVLLVAGLFLQQDAPADEGPPAAAANIPFPNVPRTELQEAQDRVERGAAVFVDVRSAEDYAASRIPGAVSVPLGPSALDPAYQDLPVAAELITYCT